MKKYKAIIFDLDGTTLNTDLYVVANYLRLFLKYDVKPIPSLDEFVYFSGPPLLDTLRKYYPNTDIDVLRKDFVEWGENNVNSLSSLYKDEIEVLTKLKEKGYKLGIVTNKVSSATEKCLTYFDIKKYFESIITIDMCVNPKPNPDGLNKCLKELGIKKEDAIYIGDSVGDMETGKNGKMDIGLVTWSLKEGQDVIKPDYYFSSFKDIERSFIDE